MEVYAMKMKKETSMKRTLSGALAVFACALVTVSAQTPPAGDAQTPPTTGTAAAANSVTVTGCLARAEAPAPTGTAGTATGAAMDTTKFVLKTAGSAAPAANAPAGTTGTAKASTASSYRLDAADAKLSPHVGHQIEVTGTVEKMQAGAAAEAGAAASAPTAPKLKVESVKMIAASCDMK
jgi:hypothetical protein